MATYSPITKIDKTALVKHPLFKQYEHELKEGKITEFLNDHGIFGGIVPFYAHPDDGGQLLGLNFEFEYRTTRKDKDHWNTEFYQNHTRYSTEEELSGVALWKALDIIQKWNWKELAEKDIE